MKKEFVHLHNHSQYSLLDGALTFDDMMQKAKQHNMHSIALTDHGNMFGVIDFYLKAKEYDIKPIIGCEFYVARGSRFEKQSVKGISDAAYHLIALAYNEEGYKNLMQLATLAYIEGFYYRPRIDLEILSKYSKGLIGLSACLAGEIPYWISQGDIKQAIEKAELYQDIFGKGNFYLELQYHNLKEQEAVNREIINIHKKTGIPLVVTNDAHYLNREDADAHEILLCIQTGKKLSDEKRMRFGSDEFYLKTPEEMYELFPDYEEAYKNTLAIAERVDLSLKLDQNLLPNYEVPEGYDVNSYFNHLVEEGLKKRFKEITPEIRERVDYELSIINKMDFPGYFLIVWDFINYAKTHGIPVGPGRGSAAGSIISYALGITEINPLEYDLLFERFLNPERFEFPDIDVDICKVRREEVIKYVENKYGHDHVSQIITFMNLKAKATIKDVARVLDIPFGEANKISSLIPSSLNIKLADAIKEVPELNHIIEKGEKEKKLFEVALKLEGLVRNPGKHAAGIVISREPLTNYTPLFKDTDNNISTQYNMEALAKIGLVKMDLLGLATLTIIDWAVKLIKENKNIDLDINKLPLDDKKAYKLIKKGDTLGVFQLESSGMISFLRRFKPDNFDDLIAVLALYRPGPLGSGMVDEYIKRKAKKKKVTYPHADLEEVLKSTYGIIVYQKQVMKIRQIIAGF